MTEGSNTAIANPIPPVKMETDTEQSERSTTLLTKSTIPKRSKNAITHGMYAEELILPWESADDLMKLRDDLWAELVPEGRMEEETAAGIVRLMWLKRRLMRTSQLGYHRDSIESASANPKDWDELLGLIKAASGDETSLVKAARVSLDVLKAAVEKISEINTACLPGHSQVGPPKEAFQAAQRARQDTDLVCKVLTERVVPRMIALEKAKQPAAATVYEKAYSHEHLEKTLRLEAALDVRIDKQMGRLVNLKEFKRLRNESLKVVEHQVV